MKATLLSIGVVDLMKAQSRRPDVVADAAYVIMCQPSREYT